MLEDFYINDCVSGSLCLPQIPLNMASLTSSSSMGGLDYETFVWDHRIYRSMFLSGFVILVYDHLLSLGSEVKLMWRRKLRPSTIWFFGLRYISLGCSCAIFAFYFGDLSMEATTTDIFLCSCSKMEKVLEALLMLQESLVETTLALRVFAMYGFKLWVAVPMGLAANLAAALGIWTIVKYGNPRMLSAPGMNGCHTAIPRSTCVRLLIRLAGAWEAQLLLDTLVFGLTLYRAHADRAVITMVPGSLIERMMRDGDIIVLANLANVVTLYIMIAGILSWWTTSLSVTLISRLILNVHRAGVGNALTQTSAEFDTTEMEGIHFVDDVPRARPQDEGGSLFEDV
ncbi:hypothetical protein DFH06DRAFT_1257938 [Mycena polygramma]|nr:hypothetical protein DFH06DRAFT_1257938 [Mycena polygramma]